MELDTIGVIAARFQVPELHRGHRYLIRQVCERHKTVVFVLGIAPKIQDHDPLSFEMRQEMVFSEVMALYGDRIQIHLLPGPSTRLPADVRSREIDSQLEAAFPGRTFMLYGSRDSMIQKYKEFGKYPVHEVETVYKGSGADIRRDLAPVHSADFRRGYMMGVRDKGPNYHVAVDVAVVQSELVYMIEKENEGGLCRFPGVFLDARTRETPLQGVWRCLEKELPGVEAYSRGDGGAECVTTATLADWRYEKSDDTIMSSLYVVHALWGEPVITRGITRIISLPLRDDSAVVNSIVPEHRQLFLILVAYRSAQLRKISASQRRSV